MAQAPRTRMRHMNPSTVAEVDRALARLRARLEAFLSTSITRLPWCQRREGRR